MLRLADHWIWDFWFAWHEGRHHVFFLKAPKSLGDPALRHGHARIGHAVSDDLRRWELLPDALGPGPPGAWDDRATWTGNVVFHDGRWWMFYSGISHADGGLVQRIGVACSDDLLTWQRPFGEAVMAPDPRWYETLDLAVWIEETCRDPWVFADPGGHGFHMYYTARAKHGPPDGRGVIGHAWSADLRSWQARPPITDPGDFGHLEVPQLVELGGCPYLIFSVYEWAHSTARTRRAEAVCGTHYLLGDSPLGPFRMLTDEFLCGSPAGPFYAGRLVRDRNGGWQFMCWAQFASDGAFIGALADPVPVVQHDDATLSLADRPSVGPVAAPPRHRQPGG